MALINGWVIYKAVCKTIISRKAYTQKQSEEPTGSHNGAADPSPHARPTRSTTVTPDTRNWKEESVTEWDNLHQNTAVHVLLTRAEIEQLTSVCTVCQTPKC